MIIKYDFNYNDNNNRVIVLLLLIEMIIKYYYIGSLGVRVVCTLFVYSNKRIKLLWPNLHTKFNEIKTTITATGSLSSHRADDKK